MVERPNGERRRGSSPTRQRVGAIWIPLRCHRMSASCRLLLRGIGTSRAAVCSSRVEYSSRRQVAVGNQDGAEPVPADQRLEDDLDDTEHAANLNPPPGSSVSIGIGSATAAAAAPGGAPILQAEGRQQQKKKDGFWMRTLKGDDGF